MISPFYIHFHVFRLVFFAKCKTNIRKYFSLMKTKEKAYNRQEMREISLFDQTLKGREVD